MNPYLERPGVWHKFHEQFFGRCMEMLVPQVRPKYIVDIDEQVYIHELPAEERRLVGRPDVYVARSDSAVATAAPSASTSTAPISTRVPDVAIDEERLSYLKIMDRDSRRVITVLELLSPANKISDVAQYLSKRKRYLESGVGLVEIDLLRAGMRMPAESIPSCDYCVMIVRPNESPRVTVWPIQLRASLPNIPIPLRPGEGDAHIHLQDLLHALYDAGGYQDYIYATQPKPPLRDEDLQWASQILSAHAPR